jgi:hypothetical protein
MTALSTFALKDRKAERFDSVVSPPVGPAKGTARVSVACSTITTVRVISGWSSRWLL